MSVPWEVQRRRDLAAYGQEQSDRVDQFVFNLPTSYGSKKRIFGAAHDAAIHHGYFGSDADQFAQACVTRYLARFAH